MRIGIFSDLHGNLPPPRPRSSAWTYDVKDAAAAIRATELSHEFAADIETGGTPRSVATPSQS